MLSNVGGGGSLAVDDRGLVVDNKQIRFYFDDGLLRLYNGSYVGLPVSGCVISSVSIYHLLQSIMVGKC